MYGPGFPPRGAYSTKPVATPRSRLVLVHERDVLEPRVNTHARARTCTCTRRQCRAAPSHISQRTAAQCLRAGRHVRRPGHTPTPVAEASMDPAVTASQSQSQRQGARQHAVRHRPGSPLASARAGPAAPSPGVWLSRRVGSPFFLYFFFNPQ